MAPDELEVAEIIDTMSTQIPEASGIAAAQAHTCIVTDMNDAPQKPPHLLFEERITARISAEAGDLITDEELQRMVREQVNKLFFTPLPPDPERCLTASDAERLSRFEHEVLRMVEPRVTEAINTWVVDNEDKIEGIIQEVLTTSGDALVLGFFKRMFADANAPFMGLLESRVTNLENNVHSNFISPSGSY